MDAGRSHTAGTATNSQLFVEDGTPIKFYVDPGSVFGRPKLIRTLKSAGASIASDPKTADFILVQSETTTGQHFTRDWSDEKTVLEVGWVSKTIGAGRLLKESDGWGGCLAVEDLTVELEDVDLPHHLPTPRITPVEPAPSTAGIYPPNGVTQLPPHNPDSNSRHSSQQPTGLFPPPSPYPTFLPNQMPPFIQQLGGQQPFNPFQGPPTPAYQFDQTLYNMALVDVMKAAYGWCGPPQLPGIQNGGFQPPMFPPQPMMYSQPPGLMPVAHSTPASPLSVSDPLPPSLSRKSSTDLKGKGKAPAYVSRGSSGSSFASSSAASDRIFISNSGEPLTFYVAIEVHNRTSTVNDIKRHGGQISTQTTADFAILSSRSKDFEVLLETVLSSNGKAVKPAFVIESVQENRLLDFTGYKFEVPAKLERKVHKAPSSSSKVLSSSSSKVPPSSSSKVSSSKKKVLSSPPRKTDAEKKQAATLQKAKARKAKKEAIAKEETSFYRIPSPTPPPENTRVLLQVGKYRYPEVENKYALSYAAILFERDIHMSYTTLAAKLNAKMPHHSSRGWYHHLTQTIGDDIRNVEKRAGIALRKEELQRQSKAQEPPPKRPRINEIEDVGSWASVKTTADSGPSVQTAANDDEEQDINVIAHFFANGGDAEETDGEEGKATQDDRVWARLAAQTPCRTEASWVVFYNTRHERIIELYEKLIAEQEQEESSVE